MGQSLQKFAPGSEAKMAKIIDATAQKYYVNCETKDWVFIDFYRAVCEVAEQINKDLGYTQFRVPSEEALQQAFYKHHKGVGKILKKDEFQKILQDVMIHTGFTGIGAKDIILGIFGVPATAFLIKQGLIPRAMPNEIFIPLVTSTTVYILAKLNKI
ncbi:unnamed protein product [Amaranthus hypochondriacus]